MEQRSNESHITFIDWWRLLNFELDKLHKNQQAGLADARRHYEKGTTPKDAANALFSEWRVEQ